MTQQEFSEKLEKGGNIFRVLDTYLNYWMTCWHVCWSMTGCASSLMLLYLEVEKLHIVFSTVRSQSKEKFLSFLPVSVVIGDLSAKK